jgi:hypothetical protein
VGTYVVTAYYNFSTNFTVAGLPDKKKLERGKSQSSLI